MIFEFDECVLDTSTQELQRAGEPVHLEPQVLAVLTYLVTNRDRMVTKIELLDEVWGDRFVSESALTSRIKLARKACGDSGREQRIVKTVHSRGYRFIAPVTVSGQHPRAGAADGLAARAVPTVPDPAPATGLFGRDGDVATLDQVMATVVGGARGAVLVRGRAGSGKTTLVAEFLERHDQLDGWIVLRGNCISTRGAAEPYYCLLEALGRLARAEPELVISTLDQVAPSWLAQLPSLLDNAAAERLERRLLGSSAARMLREGVDAIEAFAVERPVALVLEDLHQADECTLDVLDVLVQRTDPASLMVMGTARPEAAELGAVVEPAIAAGRMVLLSLGPLDRGALCALAADRLGVAQPPDAAVEVLAARCEGVPLFAEEVLAAWVRNGQIVVDDGDAAVTCPLDELALTVPASLPPLVERELSTLDPAELDLLEACAAAGDVFDAAAVALATDRPVPEVERVLADLARRRGTVVATGAGSWPDGTISARYEFTHQLFRQVLHDRTSVARRAALHAGVGEALEAGFGDRAGELAVALADHFVEAGLVVRAAEHLRRAGELAYAREAHGAAVGFLTSALEHLAATDDGPERDAAELGVRTALGPALVATRGWIDPAVSENYERALELAADDPTGAEAAAARYGLATVSELQGQFERTETLLTPLLDAEGPGHLAIEAHELVACSTFHQGAFDRSLQNASVVLDSWDDDTYSVYMARIAEHPTSSCSSWSSLALWALGRSDDSLRLAERAVELGERNRYALSTAVQQRAMLHQLRNETDACIEWSDRCREIGEEDDFVMRTIQADIYKGWALGVSGSTSHGLELIGGGLERFRDAGASLNEAYYLGLYADVVIHDGRPDDAIGLLRQAESAATSRTYFFEPELCRLFARATTAQGDAAGLAEAREALDQSCSLARTRGAVALELRTLLDRCALEIEHGDPAPWRQELAEVLATYEGQNPTPDTVRAGELIAG